MDCLDEIDDPRKLSNGTLHDFCQEILVIAIAAMLSDCDTVEDIAYWASMKEAWLRRFLVLKNGIPSEDTFLRIFSAPDPKQFETVFRLWVADIVGALGTVVVDGKTVRESGTGGEAAIHMVSAFAAELGVVLCREKIAGKSKEITAKGGDYLLMVKGNQPSLLNAVETTFISHHCAEGVDRKNHAEQSHGRIVGEVASVLLAKGIVDLSDWPKCKTIRRIDSTRVVGGKESDLERRYFINSRDLSANQLAAAVRAPRGIDNRLHWVLDVSFGENGKTVSKDNAPQNLSLQRKIVLNLIRQDKADTKKVSLRRKRKGPSWDDDMRMSMLRLTPL